MGENGRGRFAVVIPVYNHPGRIQWVVEGALKLGIPVFVVDDGSTDATRELVSRMTGVHRLRHEQNQGKGAALLTGMAEAAGVADWAITIDGDGQHDPGDADELIRAAPRNRRAIIVGARHGMIGPDVPWTSRFGRKFSNFWIQMAGGPKIDDSQSGFRVYPLPEVLDLKVRSRRFQFEVEVLVKAGWRRMPVIEAPVGVSYRPGARRISHFRPFIDFVRNSNAFTRLIFQRIVLPNSIRENW